MSILELKCPNCKEDLLSANINVKTNKALCTKCNKLHDLTKVELASVDRSYKQISDPIPGIREIKDEFGYTIEFDWRTFSNYKFHLIFGTIMTLFSLPFAVVLLFNWQIIGGLITSIFSILGIWLLNKGLQEYFNKTIIHFENGIMNIYHQPLTLFLKEIECNTDDIDQVFVKKIHAGSTNNVNHYNYDLWANFNNEDVKLFSIFKEEPEAFYVERLIENHLNIEDITLIAEHRSGQEVDPKSAQMLKFVKMMQKANNNKNR